MGLDPKAVFGWARSNVPTHEGEIPRDKFIEIVNGGIRNARLDELNEGLARRLRDIAQNNTYIYVGGWGVKTESPVKPECGCPLTEAGVAIPRERAESLSLKLPDVADGGLPSRFYGYFDDHAKVYLYNQNTGNRSG